MPITQAPKREETRRLLRLGGCQPTSQGNTCAPGSVRDPDSKVQADYNRTGHLIPSFGFYAPTQMHKAHTQEHHTQHKIILFYF